MALIKCLECGKDISDKASACPHCGNPTTTKGVQPIETVTRINTVEYTRKKWKGYILTGVIMLFVGALMFLINLMRAITASTSGTQPNGLLLLLGILLAAIGFIIFLVGSIGAWWNHG